MSRAKKLAAGMFIKDVYRIMGEPYKILRNKNDEVILMLYVKNKWFNRKEVIKVAINDGVVSYVNVSNEKPIKLSDNHWEV